jgi:hypothetical protein
MATKSVASLNALEARYADAAEQQRQKPARIYLEVLDAKVAALNGAPGIVAALEAEERGVIACKDAVRAACDDVLDTYPKPKATTPRILAAEVNALRQMASGARATLDTLPGLLRTWIQKITTLSDDAGSERYLAEAHWANIWPLFGQARALAATPDALAVQVRFIEALVADHPAQGVPVVVSQGSGPLLESLETSPPSRSYKARTEVHHE